jgi:DNA polymerase elongation subunit (family B)
VRPLEVQGWLFDIYHLEDQIYLCILDHQGQFYLCRDHFHPIIYARGSQSTLQKLVQRLHEMEGIHGEPSYQKRRLFYPNRLVDVLAIQISRPSILRRIRSRLYAMYGRMDLYHTDFEVPTGYMQQKGIFPLCRLKARLMPISKPQFAGGTGVGSSSQLYNLESVEARDDIFDLDFDLPPMKLLRIQLNYGHRLGLQKLISGSQRKFRIPDQRILFECNGAKLDLPPDLNKSHLNQLNDFILQTDPDIILSAYGDQVLLPMIFQAYQKHGLAHLMDRDVSPGSSRKIIVEGTSYNTYGNWIYRAPSYPLFGRWHIDSANSFVYKEAQLMGIVELARMSRIPVQRLSRSSTGAALTAIESEVALRKNYLVPWQKSALEEPRSVMELLEADKGGLVFVPRANGILENVAQIDFSQMYPSIMSIHNVSPETINCLCCKDEETIHVPEIGFRICKKRRGIVSDALAHILERRSYYKRRIKELKFRITEIMDPEVEEHSGRVEASPRPEPLAAKPLAAIREASLVAEPGSNESYGRGSGDISELEKEKEIYEHRQSSLKWMLVTSFGYLGYRNAKFGKIESHEAVTAFGRDKLLTAKEIAEDSGYSVIHGITDCLFLGMSTEHDHLCPIDEVCRRIGEKTGIEMSLEGIYDWVIFLPSRSKPGVMVVNRYFGRFRDGTLRVRGISVRRKDRPEWIKDVQQAFLNLMARCRTASELRSIHGEMEDLYESFRRALCKRSIPWTSLLLRRTVSKGLEDYSVDGPAPAALRELEPYGLKVQAGEKVKYLILDENEPRGSKYISEEIAFQKFGPTPATQPPYSIAQYEKLLYDAFEEVWRYAAPPGYFDRKDIRQGDLFPGS